MRGAPDACQAPWATASPRAGVGDHQYASAGRTSTAPPQLVGFVQTTWMKGRGEPFGMGSSIFKSSIGP